MYACTSRGIRSVTNLHRRHLRAFGKEMHLPNERYELNIHARKSIRSAPYAHRRHKHTIQSFEKN